MNNKQASKRFVSIFTPCMVLYGISCFAVPEFLQLSNFPRWTVYLSSIIPAMLLLTALWSSWRYTMEVDEYMRHMQLKAIIIALGCTLALTTTIGFLQIYAGVTVFSMFFVMPIFYMFYALGTVIVFARSDMKKQKQ